MKKKTAYQKLFRAKDELTETLENILYEEVRKGKETAKLQKMIEYVEIAADQTGAALAMIEEGNERAASEWVDELIKEA